MQISFRRCFWLFTFQFGDCDRCCSLWYAFNVWLAQTAACDEYILWGVWIILNYILHLSDVMPCTRRSEQFFFNFRENWHILLTSIFDRRFLDEKFSAIITFVPKHNIPKCCWSDSHRNIYSLHQHKSLCINWKEDDHHHTHTQTDINNMHVEHGVHGVLDIRVWQLCARVTICGDQTTNTCTVTSSCNMHNGTRGTSTLFARAGCTALYWPNAMAMAMQL